jgi:hypothetical protein
MLPVKAGINMTQEKVTQNIAGGFRFSLAAAIFLLLIFCTESGWATEHLVDKADGTVIEALTDYEAGDIIRITGGSLIEEDWAELRKMWTIPFHLVLENGQSEIPNMALSTNGTVPAPVISITGLDVVNIGDFAFANNNYLTSTDFPALKSVGKMAYFSCMSLREIELPKSVESLGDGAFAMCQKLVFIGISEKNAQFRSLDGVLYSADGDTLFAYPAGKVQREYASDVLDIRPFSFYGAENLERVSFSSAEYIGNGTFVSCLRLADVALPDSLKVIGHGAFDSCISLTAVTLPASLEFIGDGAFSYCERLRSISAAQGSRSFKSIDGVLYSANGEILYVYPAGKENSSFTSNVREVRAYAFMYAGTLQSVTLPYAENIGEGAFAWCSSLTAASLPMANAFGNGAFAWCVSLKLIELGSSIPAIENKTFTTDEAGFLVVTKEVERNFDLKNWPANTKIATLRGAATLGPIILNLEDMLFLSLEIEGAADYRWKKGGVLISNANEASYIRAKAVDEDSGIYSVTFRYDLGSGPVDFEIKGIEVIIDPNN